MQIASLVRCILFLITHVRKTWVILTVSLIQRTRLLASVADLENRYPESTIGSPFEPAWVQKGTKENPMSFSILRVPILS